MIHLANILIATDDPALAQDLLQKIRRHGYDGQTVDSLEAALATTEQEHPDIVLVSETLVGGTAIELAKTLKSSADCREIPLCLAAANRSPEIKLRALAAGIDDVLSPPVDETKLITIGRSVRLERMPQTIVARCQMVSRCRTCCCSSGARRPWLRSR